MSTQWKFIHGDVKENLEKKMKAYIFRPAEQKDKTLVFTDNYHVNQWKKIEDFATHTEYPLVPIPETYKSTMMIEFLSEIELFMRQYLDARKETAVKGLAWNTGSNRDLLLHIILYEKSIKSVIQNFPGFTDFPRTRLLLPSLSEESSGSTSSDTPSAMQFSLLQSSFDDAGEGEELPDDDEASRAPVPAPVEESMEVSLDDLPTYDYDPDAGENGTGPTQS